ncbi:hypothetical protein Vadar_015477 [Vaccinium darrowii]|uniref:Uncharacterized protein n=1 Tax=Vaccinium darrowii TaxID=229202 RepID=A0ACB7XZ55_9ERIC|nr:hypothetical protein Vadar_015477 [Vaccinium darrowii]
METPAINELRQRKKKSEERENSFEKEYEIPPSETEKETLSDVEREKETLPEAEREKGIPRGETTKEMPPNVERGKEIPPNDDVCPICFGDYTIPCKTNCGHWFCANCVIMFWSHGSKLLPCKCPICSETIAKLNPKASLTLSTDDEVVEALKKVQEYNSLFEGGVGSMLLLLRPLLMFSVTFYFHISRMWGIFIRGLCDPDKIMVNYVVARAIAVSLW